MGRIMCVRLTCWAIDRATRRQWRRERRHGRRRDEAAAAAAAVLVEKVAQRELVVAACERARQAGVRAGMTLAQARAICPQLMRGESDPHGDRRALVALARWMTRYSPVVSPEPPDAIFLDVGGCERLYRGVRPLIARVRGTLERMRVHARVAVAPTPGAAWAVASYGQDGAVVRDEQIEGTLAPLPVAALRLDEGTVAVLEHLGVRTVAELAALPRRALPARFGTQVLDRLDAAHGRLAEPLVGVDYPITVESAMEFDGTVESLEVLELALRELIGRVIAKLAAHGLGARQLRVEFRQAYAPPVVKAVRLGRPTRDAKAIFRLLNCALEAVESEAGGFVAVRLEVPAFERVTEGQWAMFEQEEQAGREEVGRLVELLHARFGEPAIGRPVLVESHLPERAFRVKGGAAEARPGEPVVAEAGGWDIGVRPLEVLPVPVEVRVVVSPSADGEGIPIAFTHDGEVHRLAQADGPERIEGVWWEGHEKTRDYFDVEDEGGARFWIFRVAQSGRWFLHGVFA